MKKKHVHTPFILIKQMVLDNMTIDLMNGFFSKKKGNEKEEQHNLLPFLSYKDKRGTVKLKSTNLF